MIGDRQAIKDRLSMMERAEKPSPEQYLLNVYTEVEGDPRMFLKWIRADGVAMDLGYQSIGDALQRANYPHLVMCAEAAGYSA